MEVLVNNRQEIKKISNEDIEFIEKAVEICLIEENHSSNVEVSLSFVDNNEIKHLNKQYRNKDYPTDVLSFPLNDNIDGTIILGDIVISIEKVIEQASEYQHSYKRELIYLLVHGMFHLLGYDHIKEDEKKIMRAKEKRVIEKLQLFR
jgi:probable rRNA maturation factor